ncbi:hypothetical protein IFR05_016640 [Cadophora sp. M221]|nr:hypothetical protein IFR05_016640 [Cadophora sp. M221]
MHLPAAPAFRALRVASPNDILRIGIVAACGFRYSPLFSWERPYHKQYLADTLLSYRLEFSEAIKNPENIVLVAVDQYDPDEGQKSETIILPDNGFQPPLPGEEVIVGVGCWKLEAGSKRVGQFQNDSGLYPVLPPNLNRDQNPDHVQRWSKLAYEAEQR